MTFDSVVGQTALTTTLKNAVKGGKLAHAYLFCGPRGVGKTTCARIFAKVINCEHLTAQGDACGECESCKAFNEGRSMNIFELDAASNNGVEHIKTLMEQTHIPPQTGRYKVFIIDEVHMLSTAAFNAFLKTLEEPPAHVIFILATTEKHKILPTIISRCQVYDFERMTVESIIGHLKNVAEKEGIAYDERALAVIAAKADGGMRDALSIFDQAASFCGGNITYEKVIEDLNVLDADNYFSIVDACVENRVSDVMMTLDDILSHGFDGGQMINGLASHVRNVLMAAAPSTVQLIEASDQQRQRYVEQAKKCPTRFLYGALKLLNQCDLSYRQSSNKRLLVELTLIQVAQLTQPDDDSGGAGRRPCKRLKSLFSLLMGAGAVAMPKHTSRSEGATQYQESVGSNATATVVAEDNVAVTVSGQPTAAAASASSHRDSEPKKPVQQPRAKVRLGTLTTSFSNIINGNKVTEQHETPPQLGDVASETELFGEDDVRREWLSMCNRMMRQVQYVALARRMMNVQLHITQFPTVEGVCDNALLMQDVERIRQRVEVTLATQLHNGRLQFVLRLAEQREMAHRLSPQEFLQKLEETNPFFSEMRKSLKLELE